MDKSRNYAVKLITALLLLGIAATQNCPYMECECDSNSIDCSNRELKAMPTSYHMLDDVDYTALFLDTNEITAIHAGSLSMRLTELSLMNNPIRTIDDDAFFNLSSTLKSISFRKALFTTIPNAFLRLNALKNVIIMDTIILNWNIPAMTHIGQTLESLILNNVGLRSWPDWIYFFPGLNELSITDSKISTIPDNAFDKVTYSLVILTLRKNNLTSTSKSFSNLKNVIILDLQFNNISNLTWLPHSIRLMNLPLNNNNISDHKHLSDSLRVYAPSLFSAALSFNELTTIPDLSSLTNMAAVDLSHNKISDPKSGLFHEAVSEINFSYNLLPSVPSVLMKLKLVTFLDMSHNAIRDLQAADIPPWVTNADFSFNYVTELTNTSFPQNSSIYELNLSNNAIYTIWNETFLNLPLLQSMNLQHTRLSRLPLGLASVPKFGYLDVRNCPYLICTCLDRGLEHKIASGVNVIGYCGDISIDNFFATFSLTCP